MSLQCKKFFLQSLAVNLFSSYDGLDVSCEGVVEFRKYVAQRAVLKV